MEGSLFNLQAIDNDNKTDSENSDTNRISEKNESELNEDEINTDSKKNQISHKNNEIKNNNIRNNVNEKSNVSGNLNQLSTRRILTNQFDAYNPNNISIKLDIKLKVGNFLTDHNNTPKMIKYIFANILRKSSPIQNYNLILNQLITKKKKFYDNQFPPNENSLIKGYNYFTVNKYNMNKVIERTSLQKKFKNLKWIRESDETLNKNSNKSTIFYKNKIDTEEIKIGEFSNSNFISVLSALVYFPNIIKKLFITKEKNNQGIFSINLCKDGLLQEVLIDDFFPVEKKTNKLVFSSSKNNSLWIQILEKSYAKLNGSYNNIDIKNIEGILRDFTYAPVITLDNSTDDLIEQLNEAYEKNWVILASKGDTIASQELLSELGLNPNFDYPILMVYTLTSEDLRNGYPILDNSPFNDDNYKTVIKIKNLWSKIEWIGDWSDASSFWNESLRDKFCYKENDNCFYMDLKDFKHYFSKIKICKFMNDYHYKSILLYQKPKSYTVVSFKIFEMYKETICQISLIQEDKKDIYSNKLDFMISRIILCKLNYKNGINKIEYLEGKMDQKKELIIEKDLNEGEYLLYCELSNIENETSYVISIYSDEEIELKKENNDLFKNILENIFTSCAKKQNICIRYDNDGAPNCSKYSNSVPEGFTYLYFENFEEDATLIEDVKYTKFEGLELLKPFHGTSYHIEVGPGKTQIILIKHLQLNEYNLIFSYQSCVYFGKKSLKKLAKERGKMTKRINKKNGEECEIYVYIYKYTFGLCYYYENFTKNLRLKEKINIEKNINIEFVGEKEDTNEIIVVVEPGGNNFVELKGKNNLWKVQPRISYVIENINENNENE